ncbi:YlcI/YnfO family protein [Gilliamella sp. wkB108]|uniref:YlcI/YnfO family protein n=1 Tax=Gilliamella sp. wkB108 TaxID=3120256 RepID=UPI0009C0C2AC|nr:YlcI/YnfO family protein [Gilliamella apicola]
MANETSKSKRKDIRFPHDLIEQIDEQAKKENTNFSAWVIATCREKLAKLDKK